MKATVRAVVIEVSIDVDRGESPEVLGEIGRMLAGHRPGVCDRPGCWRCGGPPPIHPPMKTANRSRRG